MRTLPYDFYHLWASARVARLGGNPYVTEQISPVMLDSGWPPSEVVSGFMHPFWSLTVLTPFSYLPFPLAAVVWELSIVVLVLTSLCLILSESVRGVLGTFAAPPLLLLATALFAPLISTLAFGQTSAILLVGCAGWLESFCRGRFFLAGLLLSLTTLKPQLFVPLYVWIFLNQIRNRELMCLTGFITGVLFQCGVALAIAPDAASQWLEAMSSLSEVTSNLHTPALARIVGSALGTPHTTVIAAIVGALIAGIWALLRKGKTAELATLVFIPLGLVTTGYVWSHSFLVLLLPYLIHISLLARFGERFVVMVSLASATWGIFEICHVHSLAPYSALLPLALLLLGLYSVSLGRQAT